MTAHTFHVEWSETDEEFIGRVDSYPSLSWLDKDPMVALQGIKNATADVDEDVRIEEQVALEYGYGKLADDPDLKSIRREVYREQQAEIERSLGMLPVAVDREDPPSNYDWLGNFQGVHGAKSKRFSRQDYWVFIGCVAVIAWILIGPVF